MGGKASLILVLGVSFIMLIFQARTGNLSTNAAENFVDYYSYTIAHQIASSGMNIAAAKLYQDFTWRGPLTNVSFNDGSFNVSFSNKGDTLQVNCMASFEGKQDTVSAYFKGDNELVKYVWYTDNENGMAWVPGDSIFGPIHTNGTLNHQNKSTIVFTDKVTAGKGISPPPKNSKTQFLGGYEVGVYNTEVTEMNDIVSSSGSGGYNLTSSGDVMKIEFNIDGTVDVYRDTTQLFDDELLSNIAANGVIYTDGDLVLSGTGYVDTPNGGVTIGAGGTITLNEDIKYLDNPLTNPNSDDLLALVAWDDIIFDNSTKADWEVQSVLMSVNGSLSATDMNKNGTFNFLGSVYQADRGNAKMFHSFQKRYHHDIRLNNITPPAYPGVSGLNLIAWWE